MNVRIATLIALVSSAAQSCSGPASAAQADSTKTVSSGGIAITASSLAKHAKKLRKKVPKGFTVVVEEPFVVVGDEPPAVVRKRADTVVRWTVDRLRADFFTLDPLHIIDIWLFADEDSYLVHAKKIFGDTPDTPYGYYSDEHGALVMNIATGGGTLVHEIVHPFMEANFPECPPWFNEGLGSLYEQSRDMDGHIWGLPNWRLPGLQDAILAGKVPSFKWLASLDDHGFYVDDPGTNYAQARYLCLYLQEQGLLTAYYHAFHKNHGSDPTGYATLKKTLGVEDMGEFKKDWEDWVMGLEFEQ